MEIIRCFLTLEKIGAIGKPWWLVEDRHKWILIFYRRSGRLNDYDINPLQTT
jgi:hypothetical protein